MLKFTKNNLIWLMILGVLSAQISCTQGARTRHFEKAPAPSAPMNAPKANSANSGNSGNNGDVNQKASPAAAELPKVTLPEVSLNPDEQSGEAAPSTPTRRPSPATRVDDQLEDQVLSPSPAAKKLAVAEKIKPKAAPLAKSSGPSVETHGENTSANSNKNATAEVVQKVANASEGSDKQVLFIQSSKELLTEGERLIAFAKTKMSSEDQAKVAPVENSLSDLKVGLENAKSESEIEVLLAKLESAMEVVDPWQEHDYFIDENKHPMAKPYTVWRQKLHDLAVNQSAK